MARHIERQSREDQPSTTTVRLKDILSTAEFTKLGDHAKQRSCERLLVEPLPASRSPYEVYRQNA